MIAKQMSEELYTSYCLLINNIEELFQIKIRKIIITGDSVGAFLAMNLVKYIIKNNLRKPDGLSLLYQAVEF